MIQSLAGGIGGSVTRNGLPADPPSFPIVQQVPVRGNSSPAVTALTGVTVRVLVSGTAKPAFSAHFRVLAVVLHSVQSRGACRIFVT